MKLIIFGILFLIAGIPNVIDPENALAGIGCVLIGILLIAYSIYKMSEANKREQEIRQRTEKIRTEEIKRHQMWQAEVAKRNTYDDVINKWKSVVDEHYRLIEEIGVAYTVANNLSLPDSPQMQHVIDLCMKDIAIAEQFKQAHIEQTQAQIAAGYISSSYVMRSLPTYPSFKRLAIIYEKQKKFEEAIAVCQRAIDLGFVNDGTDGKMPGRIARLIRKKGKSNKRIKVSDQIIIEENTEDIGQ